MKTCPVLAFTPEVQRWLRLFHLTHSLVPTFGAAFWQRTSLPGPGSVLEQEHRTMTVLDTIKRLSNTLLAARGARGDGAAELRRFKHQERG